MEARTSRRRSSWSTPTSSRAARHGKVCKIDPDTLVFEATGKRGVYEYRAPFRAAVDAAGLANLRFHDLWHSTATYLAQQGATEQRSK